MGRNRVSITIEVFVGIATPVATKLSNWVILLIGKEALN